MNTKKASFMIGIAQKAGKVKSGEFATERALKDGSARLVILSEDASENTRKKFSNMAAWNGVPVCIYLPKTELGRITGKGQRSCLAVTDENLADEIRTLLEAS